MGTTSSKPLFPILSRVRIFRMYAVVARQRFAFLHSRLMIDCFVKKKCILEEEMKPWYHADLMPPVSLYVGGRDKLVDGRKLMERFEKVEKGVVLVRGQVDEEFEHLDCIWGFDCLERIGKNVREDIWNTISVDEDVVVPEGCSLDDKGSKMKRDTSALE